MRSKRLAPYVTCLVMALVAGLAEKARSQTPDKFVKKTLRQYWLDQNHKPWSDLSYEMAVRIDPQYAEPLPHEVIESDANPPLSYTVGEFRYFSLKRDSKGTYADVPFLVYENKSDPIIYQRELKKN